MASARQEPAPPPSGHHSELPSQMDLHLARLQRFLNPGKAREWPWGTVGYPNPVRFPPLQMAIYRPEIYELPSHRHKGERAYGGDGIALVGENGHGKATREGGVWQLGDRGRFVTGDDVLAAGPDAFPAETFGPELVAELQALCGAVPPVRIPMARQYATLVVRAIFEFDWEPFLMAAATDPKAFGRILDRFGEATLSILRGWAQIERVPVVYLHDDIAMTRGLIFHPDWYREYVFPWYRRFVETAHGAGQKVLFVSDGNYLPALDDLLDVGMDGFMIEPSSVDPAEVMARAGPGKFYRTSVDNRVMDFGTPDDVAAQLNKLHALHQHYPAMWIGRGGSVPSDHPNAVAFSDFSTKVFGDGPEASP
jgi:hypothetical protein